jgi:hypothetical protein
MNDELFGKDERWTFLMRDQNCMRALTKTLSSFSGLSLVLFAFHFRVDKDHSGAISSKELQEALSNGKNWYWFLLSCCNDCWCALFVSQSWTVYFWFVHFL